VLVSGAASGIGLATALAFAQAGARVMLVDIDAERLESACAQVGRLSGEVASTLADVSDPEACEAMVARAVERFGRLDIAVNNAGIPSGFGAEFEDTSIELWRRVIDVNLNGVFWAMRAEAPALKASGGGAIVNTASVASVIAGRGMAPYVAAKHGVAGLTRAAALDLIPHGIRVNAVCPGAVDTAMLAPLMADPAAAAQLTATVPMGRVATAAEVAAAILFLCSPAASYAVGHLLVLDGGVSLA
jgi:NAD(P)-dependent dehydrogenase (short-subunit alcohol dehydrogenase family)